MIKKKAGLFTLFQSEKLSQYGNIDHFFSGKNSGFDQLEQVAVQLKLNQYQFVVPKQTHTDSIVKVTLQNLSTTFYDTDAAITNEQGIVLVVKTADCVPILLFDPVNKAIAAVHSGWRGTSKNIVGKTVRKMGIEFGSRPADLVAGIGPCIGSHNYEVGSEVINSFYSSFPDLSSIVTISPSSPEKGKLNLKEVNLQLMLREGLQFDNIEISSHCTFDSSDDFFSARREGSKTGRMINGIVLK